jgi:hypothetical protein
MGKNMGSLWRNPERRRVAWDLFMVAMALINVLLIAFDMTYQWLRPTYLQSIPGVVALYDPVKGMRPHPTTQRLVRELDTSRAYLEALGDRPANPQVLAAHVSALRELTLRVMRENAFRHGETSHMGDVLMDAVAKEVGTDPAEMNYPPNQEKAALELWPMNQGELTASLQRGDGPLELALRATYYRSVGPDGRPVDHFMRLEAPLLALFWLDFAIGWILALRRSSDRWYRYPLVHWYDVLGLFPGQMRVFRLFRLVSMYTRIYRGEVREVRDNAIKRVSTRVARLVADEVTTHVELRVVGRLLTELEEQTFRDALEASLLRHRFELIDVAVDQLEHVANDPKTQEQALQLAALTTDEVLQKTHSWPMARGLTHSLVERATVATLAALGRTLASKEGRRTVKNLVANAVAPSHAKDERLTSIVSAVAVDVVRDVGAAAQRRSWTNHETDRTAPATEPRHYH